MSCEINIKLHRLLFQRLQLSVLEDTILHSKYIGRENVLKRAHISTLGMTLNIALRWSFQKSYSKTKIKSTDLSNISFYGK